jgi:hypothetical protein
MVEQKNTTTEGSKPDARDRGLEAGSDAPKGEFREVQTLDDNRNPAESGTAEREVLSPLRSCPCCELDGAAGAHPLAGQIWIR